MGFIDYLSERCDFTIPNFNRRKPLQTIEIEVNIDCNGCEKRIRKAILRMDGARSVEINREQGKVTVEGYVDANDVLQAVRRTGKGADLWGYVPYKLATYPYAEEAYDIRAPSGYVRDVPQAFGGEENHAAEDAGYTHLFSDENPHGCLIM
ncbi:hypothetical protein V2J09_001632 [Rumex salicifolius]